MKAFQTPNTVLLQNKSNIPLPSICQVFTPEYLQTLKKEISQKTKPSKALLEALKHANSITKTQKAQIQELREEVEVLNKKISELQEQNRNLKETRPISSEYSLKMDSVPHIAIFEPPPMKARESFSIKSTIKLNIEPEPEAQVDDNIMMQVLREQVKFLEQAKQLKEKRFREMVDREAALVSEVDVLKYRNQTLNALVVSLKSALMQKTKTQPVPALDSISESAEAVLDTHKEGNLDSYISHEEDLRMQPVAPKNSGTYLGTLDIAKQAMMSSNLMVSNTEMIEVDEDYLDKQVEKQAQMGYKKDFDEMQDLIGEGLEDVKTESYPSSRERIPIDASMVAIDLNNPSAALSARSNQSFVKIQI